MSFRVKVWFWRRPEWWMLAISASAWVALFIPLPGEPPHHNHAGGHVSLLHWALMILAMMFPLLVGHVRAVAARSLWRRRHRAVALYLAGYFVPWLLYGSVVIALLRYAPAGWTTGAVMLAIAGLWQMTHWKQRALRQCHRVDTLSPFGWRADVDCVRSGCRAAGSCLLSCWALMLACAATPVAWLMPAIAVFTFVERTSEPTRRRTFVFG